MYTSLTDLIESKGILLADGATGTNLFAMGLETGDSPELWNVDHPERIEKLYRDFVEAGSDLILTNSFGGTHYRLALHKAGDRVQELNEAAARIARRIVEESGRQVIVAGSIGPTGEILEPNGPVSIEQAAAAFREQAAALKMAESMCCGSKPYHRVRKSRRQCKALQTWVCRWCSLSVSTPMDAP